LPVLDTVLAFARRYIAAADLLADRSTFNHHLSAAGSPSQTVRSSTSDRESASRLLGSAIVFVRTGLRTVAIFWSCSASIIVAAYKMGMGHERRAS
jgi:hypothetical protein